MSLFKNKNDFGEIQQKGLKEVLSSIKNGLIIGVVASALSVAQANDISHIAPNGEGKFCQGGVFLPFDDGFRLMQEKFVPPASVDVNDVICLTKNNVPDYVDLEYIENNDIDDDILDKLFAPPSEYEYKYTMYEMELINKKNSSLNLNL